MRLLRDLCASVFQFDFLVDLTSIAAVIFGDNLAQKAAGRRFYFVPENETARRVLSAGLLGF